MSTVRRPTPAAGAVAVLLLVVAALVVGAPSGSAAAPAFHTVRAGETLDTIARRHGLPPRVLAGHNGLPYPSRLLPDGMLRLTPPAEPLPPFTTTTQPVTQDEIGPRGDCPVGAESLLRLFVTYYGFDGVARTGRIVVHRSIATRTQAVFRALYDGRFPILLMPAPVPLPAPLGGTPTATPAPLSTEQRAAMTGAYNCRRTHGGGGWSEHSYGTAIDVNPVQNPYVTSRGTFPSAGAAYAHRGAWVRGMVHSSGAVRVFAAHGFRWGGHWSRSKDYMHFSISGR